MSPASPTSCCSTCHLSQSNGETPGESCAATTSVFHCILLLLGCLVIAVLLIALAHTALPQLPQILSAMLAC